MKCEYCKNNIISENNTITCKFCDFEYEPYYIRDDWDILEIDDDYEWSHLQLLYRLHSKGVECIRADIWYDKNMAYVLGAKDSKNVVARVLGVHSECVYDNGEGLMILNLFQEKYLRGLIE